VGRLDIQAAALGFTTSGCPGLERRGFVRKASGPFCELLWTPHEELSVELSVELSEELSVELSEELSVELVAEALLSGWRRCRGVMADVTLSVVPGRRHPVLPAAHRWPRHTPTHTADRGHLGILFLLDPPNKLLYD
jgi:hypothetical protein